MNKKRIVIALGHNALGTTLPEQRQAIANTAKALVNYISEDYEVCITHSNGPQVSMIHTAMSEFCKIYPEYSKTPMSVCSAMSQGYIGYDLQNVLREEMISHGIYKNVITVLTQVAVDAYDEAFYKPSKIVGRVMSEEEAQEEEAKGNHVKKVDGGYRRVFATPKPIDIIELDSIDALLKAGSVVIAAGGGGIPVLEQGGKLKGASAIIEKDDAASTLANKLNADMLIYLTGIDKVYISFGKPDQKAIDYLSLAEAKKYMDQGEFGEGNMLPKIRGAIDFIGDSAIRKAIVAMLDPNAEVGGGISGTMIGK